MVKIMNGWMVIEALLKTKYSLEFSLVNLSIIILLFSFYYFHFLISELNICLICYKTHNKRSLQREGLTLETFSLPSSVIFMVRLGIYFLPACTHRQ